MGLWRFDTRVSENPVYVYIIFSYLVLTIRRQLRNVKSVTNLDYCMGEVKLEDLKKSIRVLVKVKVPDFYLSVQIHFLCPGYDG
jgi:hypothetical protein